MISDRDRTRVEHPMSERRPEGTSPMTPAGQRHPSAAPSPVPDRHRAGVITTATTTAVLIGGAHPTPPERPVLSGWCSAGAGRPRTGAGER